MEPWNTISSQDRMRVMDPGSVLNSFVYLSPQLTSLLFQRWFGERFKQSTREWIQSHIFSIEALNSSLYSPTTHLLFLWPPQITRILVCSHWPSFSSLVASRPCVVSYIADIHFQKTIVSYFNFLGERMLLLVLGWSFSYFLTISANWVPNR